MEIFVNILIAAFALGILAALSGVALGFLSSSKEEKAETEIKKNKKKTSLRAFVKCKGQDCTKKYTYAGGNDCNAASLLAGGPNSCAYSCMGLGSCVSVCPEKAIYIEKGIAVVSEDKCTGCGACISACPKGLIELVPDSKKYRVQCSNHDEGILLRENCEVGCIGCFTCANTCKNEAIIRGENLATIDYDKCRDCGECAEVCPVGIITAPPKAEPEDNFDESEYFSIEISEEN